MMITVSYLRHFDHKPPRSARSELPRTSRHPPQAAATQRSPTSGCFDAGPLTHDELVRLRAPDAPKAEATLRVVSIASRRFHVEPRSPPLRNLFSPRQIGRASCRERV